MNAGYKARRALRHAAEKEARRKTLATAVPQLTQVIDLMPRIPRLTFISGKTHPQGNGGRKNRSGHNTEWSQALVENGSRTFAAEVEKAREVSQGTDESLQNL